MFLLLFPFSFFLFCTLFQKGHSGLFQIQTHHRVYRNNFDNGSHWGKWIQEEKNQQKILQLHPHFVTISNNQSELSLYNIQLSPIDFDGVLIDLKVVFHLLVQNGTMELTSKPTWFQQSVYCKSKTKFYSFLNIKELGIHNVLSLHTFGNNVLTNEEQLSFTVDFPNLDWIPGVKYSIQRIVTYALHEDMKTNMELFIDRVVEMYQMEMEQKITTNTYQKTDKEQQEQKQTINPFLQTIWKTFFD